MYAIGNLMIDVGKTADSKTRSACLRAVLAGAIGYFLLAATTVRLTSDGRNHATVWPADAVILALLLTSPRRRWPAIVLAGWLANLVANGVTRGWMPGLVLYGAINMAQTVLAAVLLQKSDSGIDLLANTRSVVRFLLIAGLLAPLLGATAGSLVSMLNYGQTFGPSFVRWLASNGLGLVIVTPFLKAVLDGSYLRWFREQGPAERLEAFVLLAGHALLTAWVFGQTTLPLFFLPISSLLLLSFRLGRLGTKAGVIVVALVGAVAAYNATGPMTLIDRGPVFESLFFQVYLAGILCTALPVAATVSARTKTLTRLAEREKALHLIMRHSPDGILGFDSAGVCRWADGRLEDYLGLKPEDVLGSSLSGIAMRTSGALENLLAASENRDQGPLTTEFSSKLRPEVTLEASLGILRRDGHRSGAVITLRDISVRKAREAAICRMAETDDLTGTLNRKGFTARFSSGLLDTSRQMSLALIDVDHFKSINDNYGHRVGDRVLQEVVSRLNAGTRDTDVVGRLGGDEFAILFDGDLIAAKAVCECLAESFRRAPVIQDDAVRLMVSISCGLAERRPGMSGSQLFDMADAELYRVKRAGRNGVRAAA